MWDHAAGVGFLEVTEQPYDAAYFAKYVGYAETEMGRRITAERAALVRRFVGTGSICDVGIGCGAFVEAMHCTGYDINPAGVEWLQHRGAFLDPYVERVDALTFWDALEHIADPAPLLAQARRFVFVSIPIVPGEGPPAETWKHYRPDEHCWYFTRSGLVRWMAAQGLFCAWWSRIESELGREDIETFAFRREGRPFHTTGERDHG